MPILYVGDRSLRTFMRSLSLSVGREGGGLGFFANSYDLALRKLFEAEAVVFVGRQKNLFRDGEVPSSNRFRTYIKIAETFDIPYAIVLSKNQDNPPYAREERVVRTYNNQGKRKPRNVARSVVRVLER